MASACVMCGQEPNRSWEDTDTVECRANAPVRIVCFMLLAFLFVGLAAWVAATLLSTPAYTDAADWEQHCLEQCGAYATSAGAADASSSLSDSQ